MFGRRAALAAIGLFLLVSTVVNAGSFTAGNIVLYRVGDGSAALAGTGTAVFLAVSYTHLTLPTICSV